MQDPADPPLLVAAQKDQRLVCMPAADRVHRHREAALGCPLPPELEHFLDLCDRRLIERRHRHELGRIAGLAQPGDRLADLADRASLEREPVELDDRLVPQIHRPQTELLVERAQALAGAHPAELQAACLRESAQLAEQRAEGVLGTDRIA